ncbi:MAG: MMPL family transporter [Bacteroidetes bacterium]|nr:MMPL family transporter [Bacteroidota bacterium]
MQAFIEKIVGFRWLIIILVIALTGFLGFQIQYLTINSDILSSLPDDDPDALLLKQIGEQFGGNNMGIVILETDDVFQTHVLKDIRTVTDTLEALEGITSVTSLTNMISIKGSDFGIEIGKLVDEYDLPESKEQLEALRKQVLSNDLYRGSVVSADGTATLIIFTLSTDADVRTVAGLVKQKTTHINLSEKVYYIGSPMLVTYISELMTSDLIRLIPIAFILIALILAVSFKTWRGVFLPLLTAVIAIVWAMGIMGLMGFQMSMISNNIPIILLAVGSAYTIHVLNRVNQVIHSDQRKAVIQATSYVIIPVILAAITTMIGFVSFIFGAYLDMIRDFGIFTALGTLFACLLSIFFIPSVLSMLRYHDGSKFMDRKRKSFLSHRLLAPLKDLLFRHPKYILTSWSLLILLSISGIFLIHRSVDIQDYFPKGDPTREAEKLMIEKFGGTKPVFVLFEGNMQDPDVLKVMNRCAEYMEQSPDITSTQSIADLIAAINGLITGEPGIPEEQYQIEQLWFLLEGNEMLNRFVSEDLDEGVIMSRFKSPDNESKKEFAAYMKRFIQENSNEKCTIRITGMPFVDITMDRSLINSQLGSLTIAIIFVIIVVGMILRSFPSGLYATFPIVAAIIILFGVMGFAGIPLNIGTVLVASVALGIGIDYSIHVISHFNHLFKATGNAPQALEETILISGKAIMINVFSVAGGFLVLIFSQMLPLQYFGLLIALSMAGSSQAALTLLPVVLILVHRKS